MKNFTLIVLAIMYFSGCGQEQKKDSGKNAGTATQTTSTLSDQDIADAYQYLLAREIILKQQRLDFEKEGMEWNKLVHRKPGDVNWANPNLDVVYSEAWVALDENMCVLVEIPKITGRYYTWQMLNGWGETILNINERTFPQQPYGKYGLCLKGSTHHIPDGALRVEIPSKISRVLVRVELGKNPQEAIKLQQQFRIVAHGHPKIEEPIKVPIFEGMQLPGAEMFENAEAKMASEPDINEGMGPLQAKVKDVQALVNSGQEGKARVDKVIKEKAIPGTYEKLESLGNIKNGWMHPTVVGNYGSNYLMRTVVDLGGIWANNIGEATYYVASELDGNATYSMTFPKTELPDSKAKYFWSVTAVDAEKFQVLPNSSKRYLLNKQSGLKYNPDGSLTLVFGPYNKTKYPNSNWLPTMGGQNYNLTLRYYGPSEDIIKGQYYPPALVKIRN